MDSWHVLSFVLLAGCGAQSPVLDAGSDPDASLDSSLGSAPDVMLEELRNAERVLWIGAHPDDETMVTPLLIEACLQHGATCALLVMTRGESGNCGGCTEPIGVVRTREMRASSEFFGAELLHLDYGDNTGGRQDVFDAWSATAGSPEQLVTEIAGQIARLNPTLILTFDPRHGGTCHPAHRVTGAIAIAAAVEAGIAEEAVWLVSSTIEVVGAEPLFESAGYVPMVPSEEALWTYDASQILSVAGGTGWDQVVQVHRIHQSQFSDVEVAAFRNAPASQRRVHMIRGSDVRTDDPRYEGLCL